MTMVSDTKKPSAKSQNAMIAAHLRKGERLTALVALNKFGVFRLAARVGELRESGMNIIVRMIDVICSHGIAKVAEYRIAGKV